MKRSRATILVSSLLVGLLALSLVAVHAGTDAPINSDLPGTVQNEIRIARDPNNLATFVAAYNDGSGTGSSPLGISYSSGSGAAGTWNDVQLNVPVHPITGTSLHDIFDPMIAYDSQGNVFAGYIGADQAFGGRASGLFIERSTDGGMTWTPPIPGWNPTAIDANLAASPPGGPDPRFRFNDRCEMTIDTTDNVHVVWIKDVDVGQPTSDIYYAKSPPAPPGPPAMSNPSGLNFTGLPSPQSIGPKTVNDNSGSGGTPGCPTNPSGLSDFGNAPDVEVASNGAIYVAWIDVDVTTMGPNPARIMFDVSTDGGMTFACDITALILDGSVANPRTAVARNISTTPQPAGSPLAHDDVRSRSNPTIALDPSTTTTIYMAFAADPAGAADPSGLDEADIFFSRSTDGGQTWSAPVVVNDDTGDNDQINPLIRTKPNGTIDIAWFDKRNSANDDQWDVYIAKSTDGGATFSANTKITDQTFTSPWNSNQSERWLGEYLGMVVDSTTAYVAFTSSVNDQFGDNFFDSIANSAIGGAQPSLCPLSQGFWKNHASLWPVSSLTLGSEAYTRAELLRLLMTPIRGDASLILAKQLIAAKLNIGSGSDGTPVSTAISNADSLLSAEPGRLPYKVSPRTAAGTQMATEASVLDDYNNQQLTPNCVARMWTAPEGKGSRRNSR